MQSPQSAHSLTRRGFLGGSGALTLAVLAGGTMVCGRAAPAQSAGAPVNAWVGIAVDGSVTIKLAATEMGQGVMTALPLILAEELDADWSTVRVETVTHDPKTYGNSKLGGALYTAGSTSVEAYYDIMRKAGATMRRVLIHTAAQHWSVPPSTLACESGEVVDRAGGRRLRFGQIVALPGLVTEVPAITDADLKPAGARRLIGHDVPRLELPAKTRGATLYGIDVRVLGMVYAAVLRAPVEGETPVAVSDARAKALAGVIAVVRLPDAVAVVAERWDTALAARALLAVEWSRSSPFRSADSAADLAHDAAVAADTAQPGVAWFPRGDAPGELSRAATVVEASYATEHVYHAQLEPLAAVAAVDADGKGAEIWLGTQAQTSTLSVATELLGTTPERIRFHALQMGGGFGRRTTFAREVLRDALILSRQFGRPVKLMWTREDDLKNGWFRPATAHRLRAALDAEGRVTAWHHRLASPSIIGYDTPQVLARNGNRDALVMAGADGSPYTVAHFLAEHLVTPRRARVGAWRGIGRGHNSFATECFVDELAAAAKSDPVSFRRRLLAGHPRAARVLDKVLAMSNFGNAPAGRAHGLALAPLKNSMAAGVAEISVDRASGVIRVHRFWAAVDVGTVIQPRNLVAQVEGGIVFGLSGLLKERITIQDGEVRQNNFHDYPLLRSSEVPDIRIEILPSDIPPSGAGELGVPMTGAAVANAFHALTGVRLRQMPFDPLRVKAALGTAI
jgi:isoquinoline 1-oxidoreductase beta subunit